MRRERGKAHLNSHLIKPAAQFLNHLLLLFFKIFDNLDNKYLRIQDAKRRL